MIFVLYFQNKTVFTEMEPALHLANKVVRKLIKVDKVRSRHSIGAHKTLLMLWLSPESDMMPLLHIRFDERGGRGVYISLSYIFCIVPEFDRLLPGF